MSPILVVREQQCASSKSGCNGNSTDGSLCLPGLTGPYCQLCLPVTSEDGAVEPHFYAPATDTQGARCESCSSSGNLGMTALYFAGGVAALLLLALLTFRAQTLLPPGLVASFSSLRDTFTLHNKLKVSVC